MPLLTIASAICRIRVSLMLQPKVFQVFQPIGGVSATPLSSAWVGVAESSAATEVSITVTTITTPAADALARAGVSS